MIMMILLKRNDEICWKSLIHHIKSFLLKLRELDPPLELGLVLGTWNWISYTTKLSTL